MCCDEASEECARGSKMWRLVCAVVLWNTITSQPITGDTEASRKPREIDFKECCPCPKPNLQDMGRSTLDQMVPTETGFNSRSFVDDCPCQLRESDSKGASSVLFPTAVRPVRPFVRSENTKDDPKPLLHPEVDLASSVLETLREATDEEYQDALVRDAARNAARVSELRDSVPETAKNSLTVIVNPRIGEEDAISEASNAQGTHCIHPLGISRISLGREFEHKTPIFNVKPSKRRNFDMDSAASNVQEVVGLNKGLEGLRLKTSPSLLKLLPTRKPERGNIQSLLKLRNKNNTLDKDAEGDSYRLSNKINKKIPSLKLPSLINKESNSSSIKPLNRINKLDIFKLPKPLTPKPKISNTIDMDSNTSPSVIQEHFAKAANTRDSNILGFKSILPTNAASKIPLSLKNLLNLKNIELIHPQSTKASTVPSLKLLPPLRINTPGTTFVKQRKRIGTKSNIDCDKKGMQIIDTNTQVTDIDDSVKTKILDVIPSPSENRPVINNLVTKGYFDKPKAIKINKIKTEIFDALPSPSENYEVISNMDNNVDDAKGEESDTKKVLKHKTESAVILDALPSASEINGFVTIIKDNNMDITTDFDEDPFSIKDNIEPHNSGEKQTVGVNHELHKDNEENIEDNDDDIEFVSEEDTGTKFIEETNEPISEIEISNASLDDESQGINFENPSSSEISVDADNVESLIIETEDSANEAIEFADESISQTENEDELFLKESLGNINNNEDVTAQTSNQDMIIASFENTKQIGDILTEDKLSSFQEDRQLKSEPNDNMLSNIKERITLKLNTLKNPDTKIFTVSRFAKPLTSQSSIKKNERSSLNSDESNNIETLSEDTENFLIHEKSADSDNLETNINTEDLQKFSNTLLNLSDNQDQESRRAESLECKISSDDYSLTTDEGIKKVLHDRSDESITNLDMDSSATSNFESFNVFNEKSSSEEIDLDNGNERDDFVNSIVNNCPAGSKISEPVVEDINNKAAIVSTDTSNTFKEMAPGASESVFSMAPLTQSSGNYATPVLRQSILEPSSLFDTNLFRQISHLNIPNLNVGLPTLEDIQSDISNLLGVNKRVSENEELLSDEFDAIDDCSDIDPVMATDASTTNSKLSSISDFKPFEDVNLDIFQINPLSQTSPLLSKIPSLNLNSFRTRLALPKSLDLKPLKLQSSLGGKNGGLFGATLTFGPDKSTRKMKPKSTLQSILNNQNLNILRNPLANMPILEDVGSAVRANVNSLFNSPIVKHINNPIEDTLRTTETLGNSLRTHTDNTMRNLQKTLASTMNEARPSSINKMGQKFAKPQDILEHLSLAHEDMNDKLYAIHVDLKDRLESLHERISEETSLPKLQSPLLNTFAKTENSPYSKIDSKEALSRQPKLPSKKGIVKERKAEPKFIVRSTAKDQTKLKPFKISKAASSLTPKRVEVPKLQTTSLRPPFSRPLLRDDRVQLKDSKPFFTEDQIRNTNSRRKFKPFGDFKISIGSTPPPAFTRSKQPTKSQLGSKSSVLRTEQDTRLIGSAPKEQSRFGDSRGFASDLKNSQTPVASILGNLGIPNTLKDLDTTPKHRSSPIYSRPKSVTEKSTLGSSLNSRTPVKPTSLRPTLRGTSTSLSSVSETTESPLLTKMREALRIKLSDRPPNPTDRIKNNTRAKTSGVGDMARSASENNAVIIRPEPMKENVSYKCKMVCVRE